MPFVSVTDRETGKSEPETVDHPAGEGQAQPRAGARTRDRIVAVGEAVTHRVRARRVAARPVKRVDPYAGVLTDDEEAAPSVRGHSLWRDGAASPADQWEYLRAGAWAPGEQHRLVEAIAKTYGLLLLVLTVAVTVPLWLAQRPSRTALAATVGLLWWAATRTGGAP